MSRVAPLRRSRARSRPSTGAGARAPIRLNAIHRVVGQVVGQARQERVRPAAKRPISRVMRRPTGAARGARPIPARLLRRGFSGRLLARVAAVVILCGGGWALWEGAAAPQLQVAGVTIAGNELVTDEEILGGLDTEGANVFTVRTRRLEDILQTDPAISEALVRARLPNVIALRVEEREPVVVWVATGSPVLADRSGLALRYGARSLPAIYAPEGPIVEPGGRIDAEAVRMAQSLASRLDAVGVAGARLEYRPGSGMSIIASGSPRIALGFADDLEAKLAAYAAIKGHLEQTRTPAELIDVRFLDRPYFR